MPAAMPVEAPSRWVVDKDAKRRVEDVLDQIAASGAYGGSQVLRVGAAEQRAGARVTAVRLARRSGRTALVLQGREEIRTAMAARYARFNVGMVFGSSGDLSTGRERVEIAIALEDLVLATAVQDLLGFDDLATLSSDGSSLLHDLPRASMFFRRSHTPPRAPQAGGRAVRPRDADHGRRRAGRRVAHRRRPVRHRACAHRRMPHGRDRRVVDLAPWRG